MAVVALTDGVNVGAALRIGATLVPVIGSARVYVCGITPYDTTHLGHAATFVWTDLAARVLHLAGAHVDVCRNVTDVDDHLLAEAKARGVTWRSLAAQETYRFERDASDLGVIRPAFEPRSHDHVDDVIALAAGLVARGAAYERGGAVYFRGAGVHAPGDGPGHDTFASSPGGSPAPQNGTDAAPGGPHDEGSDDAESPDDVAVWHAPRDNGPTWPSPWGPGRPGWHAECAAMALSTFGASIDLHGGGADLRFPHHAYESAMVEAFTGVSPFARSWMHVGTVRTGGRKMAKSTGNLVFVHDLLQRWPAAAIRYLILARSWRDDWEFEEESLDRATRQLDDLWRSAVSTKGATSTAGRGEARRGVVDALLDDLDVPRSLTVAGDAGGLVLAELLDFLGLRDTTIWY